MAIKMTFSLDEETAARLEKAAEVTRQSKSRVVREAIRDYADSVGKLSISERERLLHAFDELVPAIPARPQQEVDEELAELRRARRGGGRKSSRAVS